MPYSTQKQKTILFIINPISGGKNKNAIPKQIEEYFKNKGRTKVNIVHSKYKGHAYKIAKTEISNFSIIVAVGGDGTINEVGRALVNTKVSLGIIPLGSGNGLAFGLGFKKYKKLNIFLDTIYKGATENIDTATINGDIFLNIAGFGFDGYISYRFDIQAKRGLLNYTLLSISSFFSFPAFSVSGRYNETKKLDFAKVLFVGIANGREFGNHFTIAPKANFSDQKIELIIVEKPSLSALPKFIFQMRWGNLMNSKYVNYFSIHRAQLICSDKQYVNIDGEYSEQKKSFNIELFPSSLTIITPQ